MKWFRRFAYFCLLLLIVVPVSASAQSDACPPKCYAGPNGTTTDLKDATAGSLSKPWKVTASNPIKVYFAEVELRIKNSGQPGTLRWAVVGNTWYETSYNSQGTELSTYRSTPPPGSGVPLPFPTLLIGLVFLGGLLLVAGYLLRPRLLGPAKS